jgi:hypothetical protein
MLGGAFAGRGVQGLTGRYDCGGAFSWWRWGSVGEDEKCGTLVDSSQVPSTFPSSGYRINTVDLLNILT